MGNGGCLRTRDELSFYFSGSALKHGEVELENLTDPTKRRVISRAVARPDRLDSVTAGNAGGQFDTPLIRFAGDQLVVNAVARPGGAVRVGLLDADVFGFQFQCKPSSTDGGQRNTTRAVEHLLLDEGRGAGYQA